MQFGAWTPKAQALNGGSVKRELSALRKPTVWGVMLVAATGVAAIFVAYAFIGPMVTDVVHLPSALIPVALSVFGLGMTAGNIIGGALADRRPTLGILLGYGAALVVLAALAVGGAGVWVLFPARRGPECRRAIDGARSGAGIEKVKRAGPEAGSMSAIGADRT